MGEVTDSNSANPIVEDISLVCSVSQKRLVDPVLVGTEHVNRDVSALRRAGGELFKPSHRTAMPAVADMEDSTKLILNQLLSHSKLLDYSSKIVFFPHRVDPPSSSSVYSLDSLGRDFHSAIKQVNETDLVTRGPLDLKAVNVIPLQIVLDEVVRNNNALPLSLNSAITICRGSLQYSLVAVAARHETSTFLGLRVLSICYDFLHKYSRYFGQTRRRHGSGCQ